LPRACYCDWLWKLVPRAVLSRVFFWQDINIVCKNAIEHKDKPAAGFCMNLVPSLYKSSPSYCQNYFWARDYTVRK
jgi:hypothetical protein